MKRSNRLILLLGILLAVLAAGGILLLSQNSQFGTGPSTPSAPTELPTVYAAKDIPLGTIITADMLESRTIAVIQRDPTAFSTPDTLLGKVARATIPAGKQLTASDFGLGVVRGALTTIVTPVGLRAIAVQVDQLSGVGTVIDTGDYVDVVVGLSGDKLFPIVTFAKGAEEQSPVILVGEGGTTVKLILQGIQVLGTALPPPTTTTTPNGQPAPSASPSTQQTTSLNQQNELVILAVTPQQAEVIRFAEITAPDATISLLLRSPKDFVDAQGNPIVPPAASTTGITLKTLVDKYGVLTPEALQTILQRPETITRVDTIRK